MMMLKPFRCPICSKHFACFSLQRQHTLRHQSKYAHLNFSYNLVCSGAHHRHMNRQVCKFGSEGHAESLKRHTNSACTKEKPYKCEYCRKGFTWKSHLYRHIRLHTKEKPYQCGYCQERFTLKGPLTLHIRMIHTKEKPYQCEFCQKRYSQKGHLTGHIRTHTKEKPYQCEYCQKRFALKGSLIRHLRIHTKEKPYQCKYCHKRFRHKGSLKRHMHTKHAEKKTSQCEVSPKGFLPDVFPDVLLKRHIDEHTTKLQYQCRYCQKRFAQKNKLENHIITHRPALYKKKQHHCEYCQKGFFQIRSLENDTMIHTKEKPYQCNICHKQFAQRHSLAIHNNIGIHSTQELRKTATFTSKGLEEYIRTHSTDNQRVYGQKEFTEKDNLDSHVKAHNKEKPSYICEYCQEECTNIENLVSHVRIHTKEKPSNCQKEFKQMTIVTKHIRIRDPQYQCEYCQRRFSRIRSLQEHIKKKHYQCEYCQKRFTDKNNLESHIRAHTKEKPPLEKPSQNETSTEGKYMPVKTKKKSYQCKFCPKEFKRRRALIDHMTMTHIN